MKTSGVWPVAQGVAWRTLKNVVTNPSILLPSLLFPLLMFTAFAGGLSQVQELPGFEFEDGYTMVTSRNALNRASAREATVP